MPACNTEAMNLHLAEIAATVAPAAHAILLVDQAGWHLSTRLLVPANITIILLPPKCPELNPVENVWQFMRDNWLSNRIFKSYDDLVDHCCAAWNKLVDQPWRIMSIGLRQWGRHPGVASPAWRGVPLSFRLRIFRHTDAISLPAVSTSPCPVDRAQTWPFARSRRRVSEIRQVDSSRGLPRGVHYNQEIGWIVPFDLIVLTKPGNGPRSDTFRPAVDVL